MLWQLHRRETAADSYDHAVLCEVQMLLEFIAGLPDRTVATLHVADPEAPARQLALPEFAGRLAAIEEDLHSRHPLSGTQRILLLSLRDALNAAVHPASGASVAYTAMVLRTSRGRFSKARAALAQCAFPGLAGAAVFHRYSHVLLLLLASLFTVGAVWESTKVALGQLLLTGRGALRAEQQAIAAEKLRVEASLAQTMPPPFDKLPAGLAVRLCERPALLALATRPSVTSDAGPLPQLFESVEEQDVCDRDRLLAYRFASSFLQLRQYRTDWPRMVGGGFGVVGQTVQAALVRVGFSADGDASTQATDDDDLEYGIAPDLLVTGNYVLPVVFAMLGACAHAVRDFYRKAAANLLMPGDRMLSWVRLILGVLVGACIGLFFSSGQSGAPLRSDNLLGALTLSASGLAFIGGYGVEGVFSMLNALVGRVFSADAAAGKR